MSFAAITVCIASQRVFIVVYFVIDSVRKLLDTPSDELENIKASCKNAHRSGNMEIRCHYSLP
jgi:hypothetical protein